MFISTKKKIYEIKFGLKSLILLSERPDLVANENFEYLLYISLLTSQPDITMSEVKEIIEECGFTELPIPLPQISKYQIQDYYIKAVGEVGIPPSEVRQMTLEDIDEAYEGYLRRQETTANLVKIALKTKDNVELIRLTENVEYNLGTLQEREEVFRRLKLTEGEWNEELQ